MLPRKSAAAFSTACDAVKTVSAELCMSAMAVETRRRTDTTDLVPDAAAATLLEIWLVEACCSSTADAIAAVNC